MSRPIVIAVLFVLKSIAAGAQDASQPPATLLDHDPADRWYVGGQVNLIAQRHGTFTAPYSGEHSFDPARESALSRLITVYAGARLGEGWEVILHIESAGGGGLSDALGLAGFTDLDVVRNPTLGAKPYVARASVRKIIALSSERTPASPTPIALSAAVPARRLEIRAGKLSLVDFFDLNAVGSDSHLQFENWTVDNNGAYDYAADTRGYTVGVILEYDEPRWSLRGAEALMPTVANGLTLDWHVQRARGENVELELRPTATFTARLLGYANHANMGRYDEAVRAFAERRDEKPDIEAHRAQGRVKYGAGVNLEWRAGADWRAFMRSGWNEGQNESFAYTEVNDSFAAGADLSGARWSRGGDRIGIAIVSNGLSTPHRAYLRFGGLGFLLGDGTLRYGREGIVESYYTARLWRGVFASAGAQYVRNPGYNQDRGPVLVTSVRMHVDF